MADKGDLLNANHNKLLRMEIFFFQRTPLFCLTVRIPPPLHIKIIILKMGVSSLSPTFGMAGNRGSAQDRECQLGAGKLVINSHFQENVWWGEAGKGRNSNQFKSSG